jgi:hypothetical protein
MKQVEEEYYKTDESNAHAPNGSHTTNNHTIPAANELYPPSPDQPIHLLSARVPEPVQEAVNSLIVSRKTVGYRNTDVNDMNIMNIMNDDSEKDRIQDENIDAVEKGQVIHYADKLEPPILQST